MRREGLPRTSLNCRSCCAEDLRLLRAEGILIDDRKWGATVPCQHGYFIIGLVLLWVGVSSRLARRERRITELAALDYPIKVATFWGRDAKAERQVYFD